MLLVLAACDDNGADETDARAAQSIDQGRRLFQDCAICHIADRPQHRPAGPHLVGLFGRRAGSAEGFRYSDAIREAGIVWTRDTLAAYLVDPTGHIPGSRMFATGLGDPDEIDALLDYLEIVTNPDR